MSWKKVKLGSIVTVSTGKYDVNHSDENGVYPFYTCAMLPFKSNTFSFDDEMILLPGNGANVGEVMYFNGKIEAYQRTYVLHKINANVKYIYYYLKGCWKRILSNQQYGSATNYIRLDNITNLEIPLPPLATQQRIASILDAADTLRRKDQELLQKYDALAQAIFIDMFGDPVKNEKGWEVRKFSEIGTLDRGVSKNRPRNSPELLGGSYPLIQTGDVANSGGIIKHFKATYSEIGLKQSKMWSKGTLCITIAANIAKTGILSFDACFPDSIVGFKAKQDTSNVVFVQYWIGFLQKILEDNAPESAQKNINLELLRNLEVICPPIELQNAFSKQIKTIISQKDILEVNVTENLFQTLLQKSFKAASE